MNRPMCAVLIVCGGLCMLRTDVPTVLVLLSGFNVVTIAAERVEPAWLTLPAASGDLLLAGATIGTASALFVVWPALGGRAFSVAVAVAALWPAIHDIAVRTIRTQGLPRIAATAMPAGYAWLLVAAGWVRGRFARAGAVLPGPCGGHERRDSAARARCGVFRPVVRSRAGLSPAVCC